MRIFLAVLCAMACAPSLFAAKNAIELITMSAKPNDDFRAALIDSMGEENIVKGTAVLSQGTDFVFAVESTSVPTLFVNEESIGKMRRVKGWHLWYYTMRLDTGRIHSFYYTIKDKRKGGLTDVPAYPPECYPAGSVPQGTLSEKLVHHSEIYPSMTADYWIYVPAQYNPSEPAALMVWQDGHNHVKRDGRARTLNVVDHLIHQGKMPPTIQVFISPGFVGDKRMRSIQYDTVDNTYGRYLRDEILAEVDKKYNFRKDAYSRAIGGVSSGGICAFNVAWQMPGEFSRVLSLIGSYTSIQWKPGELDGGNIYPFKVRKEAVRNIRVWLQGGSGDLENAHGSWPMQNIQLANSLKLKGYDFHFSFGDGAHNAAHGYAEMPQALTWLWRDYDPAQTQQIYEMDPEEKKKQFFRVKALNR
ncbi:MAG: esterase family protein [bacterium]|nr:esterase family protein [bacterium]